MVLKKQTVWLLTMLSLIVVLSVYYVTSPNQIPGDEVAYVGDEETGEMTLEQMPHEDQGSVVDMEEELAEAMEEASEEGEAAGNEEEAASETLSNAAGNDTFSTIRMDLQASRDRMAEELTQIVASADTSALMKSEAHDKRLELQRLAQNEATLETLIKAKGYEDVLVMTEEDRVRVIVQTDELSRAEANEIYHMTFDQLGAGMDVAVTHQAPAQ
ncbi:SpoIIIAH-like family protein [Alkalihalobacillus oceani]|uniref:SpoIIIAH-like family protein n=1 Tax=Halalkalibacter oceani TaxID=1653776 RepID=UPI002041C9B7|nr:SpoIIIAH-like family protein [Halalkalibacter oceani]MCM3762748.1 SpoIIIAH-like family protein [Halalkalibacter oceani]